MFSLILQTPTNARNQHTMQGDGQKHFKKVGHAKNKIGKSEIVSPPPKTGTPQVHLITNTLPKHSRHMEKKHAFFVIAIKEAFQTARHTKAYKHVWVEG